MMYGLLALEIRLEIGSLDELNDSAVVRRSLSGRVAAYRKALTTSKAKATMRPEVRIQW